MGGGGESTPNRQKIDSEFTICINFSKKFPREALDPHLQAGDIHSRIYTSKGKKSPHHVYRSGALKTKITQKFGGGGGSTRNRQKMDSECTICIYFFKKFPGGGPWTPTCRRGISTPASIQLRVKICRKNFGGKINTQSAKNGLRMHHFHHFSKNFPGEAPRTPTCGRGFPPPTPSPCGALRRFGYAPPPGSGPSGSATVLCTVSTLGV